MCNTGVPGDARTCSLLSRSVAQFDASYFRFLTSTFTLKSHKKLSVLDKAD